MDLVALAKVRRPQGLRGELRVGLMTDFPEHILRLKPLHERVVERAILCAYHDEKTRAPNAHRFVEHLAVNVASPRGKFEGHRPRRVQTQIGRCLSAKR